MTSPAQIAANRRNALKSTGPKTPQGKFIASRNAVAHGLTADRVILDGEDHDRIVALTWRLRRGRKRF